MHGTNSVLKQQFLFESLKNAFVFAQSEFQTTSQSPEYQTFTIIGMQIGM